jgi:hypothetical protein
MTSNLMQPKALANSSAANSSAADSSPVDRSAAAEQSAASARAPAMEGALLRALLAGAVALLVLLLPGQLAASHADVVTLRASQLDGQRAWPGAPSPRDRAAGREIRHGDTC